MNPPPSEPSGTTGGIVARVPVATYRFQLNRDFTFREAAELVPYLSGLGISDVYVSPLMASRAGSDHGYDVVDHSRINPDLGTEADLASLADTLRRHGMGLLLDIVPNHMCVSDPANRWWTDVLENGPSSPYAHYFDIDWRPPKAELEDKVLLPLLGDQYGRVLENREITIAFEEGTFFAHVYDLRLPVAPRSWGVILESALQRLRSGPDDARPEVLELESILTAIHHLPPRTDIAPEKVRERLREKEIIKRRLSDLYDRSAPVRTVVDETLGEINGRRGDPRSFDHLETLMAEQAYRLCFWRVAADEINYRRFFDINELAAIRVEDPEVFEAVHERVVGFIRRGWVTGLRVDHVDGLFDPLQYLRNLQESAFRAAGGGDRRRPFCIYVEKILGRDERLAREWPVHGTTGYDFLNLLNGVFVDGSHAAAFDDLYRRLTGASRDTHGELITCKKLIMLVSMASELYMLGCRLDQVSEQHRESRDFTLESLRFALREVVACFPVYRSYIRGEGERIRPGDHRHVMEAIQEAKRRNPATSPSIFEFIRDVWLLQHPGGLNEAQEEERQGFVMRLQQFTGPVMAKALEDTFFYRHFPLASLNEVGGELMMFGTSREEFHRRNVERLESWPHALLATTTHDTKRSEDARARINVLSEIPEDWAGAVERWSGMNRSLKTEVEGDTVPDANEEYLFYQTLVGSWPPGPGSPEEHAVFIRRMEEYMLKAVREAKLHTSWISPNERYEEAACAFVRSALGNDPFTADFRNFHDPIHRAGMCNSLSQTLLKIASPGVPDFYRGTEIWDYSLVDPDNRRPVDYARFKEQLEALSSSGGNDLAGSAKQLLEKMDDGRIKMHVTRSALRFRAARRELFEKGSYVPLQPDGARRDHACAFARALGGRVAIVAAGRFFLRLDTGKRLPTGPEVWAETTLRLPEDLAGAAWRDVFTGRRMRASRRKGNWMLSLGEAFALLPVALLERLP